MSATRSDLKKLLSVELGRGLSHDDFRIAFEELYNFQLNRADYSDDEWDALSTLFDVVARYSPIVDERLIYPGIYRDEQEVEAAVAEARRKLLNHAEKALPVEEQLIRSFLRSPSDETITIHSRKFTGVGLYTDFSVAAELRAFTPAELPAGPMQGPGIESPEIPYGAGSLLWVKASGIHTLEIFAYADPFPETLSVFKLQAP
jgi:hypothetical protein